MAVRIGHASKDERGKYSGGTAGDQTGKEVCIRNWYNGGWKVLLRAKEPAVAKKIAQSCAAACGNDNLGYDQSGRNTGLQAAKAVNWDMSKIQAPAEFDCSSLVTACVEAAGVHVWSGGNAPTTRNLEKILTATGAFLALSDEKYITGTDYLLEGDILLKPGSHVVIVLDDGAKVEKKVPDSDTAPKKDTATIHYSVRLPLLKPGMESEAVRSMQHLLLAKGYEMPRYGADGDFGEETENALLLFQEDMNLEPDAKCGPATWSALLGLSGEG